MHPDYPVHQHQGNVFPPGVLAQPHELTPVWCDACVPKGSKNEFCISIIKTLEASSEGRGAMKVGYTAVIQMGYDK